MAIFVSQTRIFIGFWARMAQKNILSLMSPIIRYCGLASTCFNISMPKLPQFYYFITLGRLIAVSLFRKELHRWDQCEPPLHMCDKPPTQSNPAQLLAENCMEHVNTVNDAENDISLLQKFGENVNICA